MKEEKLEFGDENMTDILNKWKGILLCFFIAIPSWLVGKKFEIVGGAVIAIIIGMIITLFWKDKGIFEGGIKFTSKKILQWAVVMLGFGLQWSRIWQRHWGTVCSWNWDRMRRSSVWTAFTHRRGVIWISDNLYPMARHCRWS